MTDRPSYASLPPLSDRLRDISEAPHTDHDKIRLMLRAAEERDKRVSALLEAERARADEAEKGKDYAIRWANRSVDSVKTECFKEIDATRKVLETWDTPTDMPLTELAKARVERLRQAHW